MKYVITCIMAFLLIAGSTITTHAFYVYEVVIPVLSAPVYVDDTNGLDTNTGGINDPVKTVTKAVEIAKVGGMLNYQILIAEGDYNNETVPLELDTVNISLFGGYYDHFQSRDSLNHQTSIEGGADITVAVTNINSTISGIKFYNQTAGLGSVITVNTEDSDAGTNRSIVINAVEIEDCTSFGGAFEVHAEDGDSVDIYNNFIHDMEALGGGMLIDGSVVDAEIYNNFLYNNVGINMIVAENTEIYNNVIVKNNANGISLRDNSEAYFNTIVNNGYGIGVGAGYSGAVFENNLIAHNTNEAVTLDGSATFDYNAYHDNGSLGLTLASNDVECDPLFSNINSINTNDFELGPGSTCIDMGTEIAGITMDYFDNERNKDGNADSVFASDPGAAEADGDLPLVPEITGEFASPDSFSPDGDSVNDTTTIGFDLNVAADVTVTVLEGATTIKVLANEVMNSGTHNVVWDGTNTASDTVDEGDYTVKIEASNTEGLNEVDVAVTVDMAADSAYCAGFTDVTTSHPLCPAITYVKDEGIFEGYPDGSFRPNQVINRVETTKVILEGFSSTLLPDDGTDLGFSDVILNSWYMTYLKTAQAAGIVEGYPDGTFKPIQQVVKVELLKIFFETSGDDLSGITVTTPPYPDTPLSAVWYLKYVQFCKDHSLIDTDALGNFKPGEGMKRGDVAKLFYRYYLEGLM